MFTRASRFGETGPTSPVTTPRKPTTPKIGTPNTRTPRKTRSALDLQAFSPEREQNRTVSVSSNRSSKVIDFFDHLGEAENERPSYAAWMIEKDALERKIRDLQQQKGEWEHQMQAKYKQIDSLESQLRRSEERVRLLTIDNSTLGGRVSMLEDRLKEERSKESSLLSHSAFLTQRVKVLEKKLGRVELELDKKQDQSKKENDVLKRSSLVNIMGASRKGDSPSLEIAHLRDELAKLEKEKRLFNAKLRDIQNKHQQEKRQLQAQVASLRNIPASEQQHMAAALQSERLRWEKEMNTLRHELEQAKLLLEERAKDDNLNHGPSFKADQRRTAEIDRRLSGFSDISDAFSYKTDDDSTSLATLENLSIEIPSLYRATQNYNPTTEQPGHLAFREDDLILIRKKTSDDTWIGELDGNIGLVPAGAVEDVNQVDFESAGLDTLPPPTELASDYCDNKVPTAKKDASPGQWSLPW
ncbi:uncharacterized protein SPPG_05748 [Spizellomyces punctatus DAOM BR117]|uniref:SH3 domain-containing protein n=1 Tax=Spizellomyces punctatus (strain DAOM BR117) TaxID=645134 RepID=A0A0L0HC56_SPIPD|nr:uncharacterized protein SPPG_05748 [Spizellomyces punctatus DAOM BR117]KNC98767.1 hypothetical protein SPPG_05748 [Spizellomyces punctatus DAOM BR117]|eukprot:XP_016606807.1 hypothetical protein SPPG_05748 [Spizellomyces punctatus DAOM BR117]